jgi:hypothetical protein
MTIKPEFKNLDFEVYRIDDNNRPVVTGKRISLFDFLIQNPTYYASNENALFKTVDLISKTGKTMIRIPGNLYHENK